MGEYAGMAVEERLEKAEIFQEYKDACKDHDIEKVIQLLKQVEIHPQHARQAAEQAL